MSPDREGGVNIVIHIDKEFIKFLLDLPVEDLSDILGLSGRYSNLFVHTFKAIIKVHVHV